jgi:hypothetical protein
MVLLDKKPRRKVSTRQQLLEVIVPSSTAHAALDGGCAAGPKCKQTIPAAAAAAAAAAI